MRLFIEKLVVFYGRLSRMSTRHRDRAKIKICSRAIQTNTVQLPYFMHSLRKNHVLPKLFYLFYRSLSHLPLQETGKKASVTEDCALGRNIIIAAGAIHIPSRSSAKILPYQDLSLEGRRFSGWPTQKSETGCSLGRPVCLSIAFSFFFGWPRAGKSFL